MSPQKSTETQVSSVSTLDVAPLGTDEAPAAPSYRKPRADLYTVLLVVALVAVLIGILFLYLEMDLYEFKLKDGPPVAMVIDHARSLLAALIPNS